MTKAIILIFLLNFLACSHVPKNNAEIIKNMDETITFRIGEASLKVDPNDGAKDISMIGYGVEFLSGKDVSH